MGRFRVIAPMLGVALALAGFAAPAGAEPKVLTNTPLVGIATAGETVRGITGGGLPWVVAGGSMAKVSEDGDVKVVVHGLLFAPGTPNAGTRGSIATVVASVVCADGSVVSTDPVPLSLEGDAIIRDTVTLPAGCEDPIVLVRTNGTATGRWLAGTV